ncbi:hypothetical protein PENTCL1PPCAC_17709 [Pristionchus entomophagus]|uniref:Rga-5 n=1 Tax=Pristionchus entomophagus TaxID=358040 RepID=A0AAV5TMC5_9BILA|nr:hypothetical protein PENTCL1PPCAC_17709 [Pristionchus entomophagus]
MTAMTSASAMKKMTVCLTGVSGSETVKGSLGVGKSLLCNRFVRGHHDDFFLDHSSTLSQTDFSGSPVINNDHWLYWGERIFDAEPSSGETTLVRVIEQTEFVDDETFEPIAGPSYEPYEKRCARIRLESRDKLMYIRQHQLGAEDDFPQRILPNGETHVTSFVFVFDISKKNTPLEYLEYSSTILTQLLKTKRSVVIAAAKFDAAEESGKQALNRLVARKSFRDIPIIQVSALCNVNVDELFAVSIRPKSRLRIRPYEIAVKNVDVANRETRSAYNSLLHALVSSDGWPSQRTPWSRLVGEMGMSRNPSFLEFLRAFGMGAARATYDSHVQEVREKCMKARLRALIPSLSSAFNSLLDRSEAVHLEWLQAREKIYDHALFDAYFLPLGTLGRLLEPMSSEEDLSRPDARFPAEILLRPEAKQEYDTWKNSIGNDMRRVKLEEETERFLAACPQVTPGRPLAEVRMLLAGSTSILDALTPAQLAIVYDRFQGELISRSESELAECLLEHIEIFVELIVSKREFSLPSVSTPVVLSNNDMDHLRTVLQEDLRYRQLSGVRERREWMVREWAAFLSLPFSCRCPALMKCIDVISHDTVQAFIQRRRQLMEGEEMERMEMVVYGQETLSRMFCIEIHRSQMEGRLRPPQPIMQLMCREGGVEEGLDGTTMRLFLVESQITLAKYRDALKKEIFPNGSPPSLFLIACPEEDYHLIPLLQQDTSNLAESTHGYMVTPRPGGESSSGSVDSPSPFPPSHLLGVMENAMEIVESRRGFIRAQMSMMCGEGSNPESLLSSLLSPPFFRLLSYRSNSDSVTVIPLLTQKGNVRVDLRLSSYHSWLCMRPRLPIHAHIVVYSAKRCASWAHARAGVRRILEEGDDSLTGRALLIVAIANDVTDYFRDEETNVLLTEGSELASSVGAQFVSIGENGGGGGMGSGCSSQLSSFFDRISLMMPPSGRRSANCTMERQKSIRLLECEYVSVKRVEGEGESRQVKEVYTRETMAATAADGTKSAAPTTRRRPAPPRLLFNRYSMVSSSSAPLSSPSVLSVAPLATPEPLDLAAEYSTVQDSGSSEDDYAQIGTEVVEKKYSASEETTSKDLSSSSSKISSIRPLPSSHFSSSSPSSPPSSSSSILRKSTAPPIFSTPSLSSLGYHKMSTPSCLHLLGASLVSPSMSASVHAGSTTSPSLSSVFSSSGPSSLSTHPLTVRSLTMDVINMDSVAAARAKVGMGGGQRGQRGMRNSISVESLSGNGEKREKKSSFVRKIKSSFRRRPRDSSVGGLDGGSTGGGGGMRREGGASLPQSPALGAVRRFEHKKKTTLPIVTMTAATPPGGSCSTEKSWASAGFSWLAGRSPHRRRKERAATSGLERESSPPSALLASLIVEGTHPPVPRFVANAVQLIEKEGGLSAEGIYRLSGSRSQQEELEQRLALSNSSYSSPVDVYSVAVALKNFFLRLPEPVIPKELQGDLLDATDVSSMRNILSLLPVHNRNVLVYLLAHLDKVADSSPTAMTHANLAIVWLPALIQPQFKDLEHLTSGVDSYKKTVRMLLENWRLILPLDNTLLRSF